MLLGISPLISPELIHILMEMGHGDELVIADANFPARSVARETATGLLVRMDGADVPEALAAILPLFPLDYAVAAPVLGMAAPSEAGEQPVHEAIRACLARAGRDPAAVEYLSRFAFYERARRAYAVLATGETRRFANVVLKKGVVTRPL